MTRVGATFAVFAGLLATTGVVLLSAVSSEKHNPSAAEWRQVAIDASSGLIPKGSQSCGVVGLREDALPASACVQAAIQKGQSFWVLSEGQGEDSHVWSLVIGSADGELSGADLDSYGWEGRGQPSFSLSQHHCELLAGRATSPAESEYLPAYYCARRDT